MNRGDSINYWWERMKNAAERLGLLPPTQDPTVYIVNRAQAEAVAAQYGGPRRYKHWSFGKRADLYPQGASIYLSDLMVLGGQPRAFMPQEFSLPKQIVFLAHLLALNDFTRRNIAWVNSSYQSVWESAARNAARVDDYIANPSIGDERVSAMISAAHALRYQCSHSALWGNETVDLLEETAIQSRALTDWQKDILDIVHEEWRGILSRLETKLCASGYAAFWQMLIVKKAGVSGDLYAQCQAYHNETIAAPKAGHLNFQQIGYEIFRAIDKQHGREAIWQARDGCHDITLVDQFLTEEVARQCGLFSWGPASERPSSETPDALEYIRVADVSDKTGWEKVRAVFVQHLGCGPFLPLRIAKGAGGEGPYELGRLVLKHAFQGKLLDPEMTRATLKLLSQLWGLPVEVAIIIKGKAVRYIYDKSGFRMPDF